mmetsp:Transcript_44433/g.107477  ORF Transcript_44433/g.107477 Transcript_44433/m.107477 type:complete len:144 (+) Transcript_44433:292-723(+)
MGIAGQSLSFDINDGSYATQAVMSVDEQNDFISHLANSCAIGQHVSKAPPGFPLQDAELRQTDNNAHNVPLPFEQPVASIAVSTRQVLQAISVDGSDARHVSNCPDRSTQLGPGVGLRSGTTFTPPVGSGKFSGSTQIGGRTG